MKKIILIIFSLFLFPAAFTQFSVNGPGAGTVPFQGIGNLALSSIQAYYAFRCYSLAYSGNVVLITDSATGNTTGSILKCSSGTLVEEATAVCTGPGIAGNVCSPVATTCATACNVYKLYDQSGSLYCVSNTVCDAVQATNSARPTFTFSCLNGRPCMACVAATSTILTSPNTKTPSATVPITMIGVGKRTTGLATLGTIFSAGNGGTMQLGFGIGSGKATGYNGTIGNITVTEGNNYDLEYVANGASSKMYANGIDGSIGNTGTTGYAFGFPLTICSDVLASNKFTGSIYELILFTADLSASFVTIDNNIRGSSNGWNF